MPTNELKTWQAQAQAQVQRRKAAAQPCRWHTWAVLAREQQCW